MEIIEAPNATSEGVAPSSIQFTVALCPPEYVVAEVGVVTLNDKNDEHWNWSHEQPIAHTKTVAKATEMREKTRRAFDNIIQVAEVKESEFKRASVTFRGKKKWVAAMGCGGRFLMDSIRYLS